MAGLGPSRSHTGDLVEHANSAGVEFVFDVMFWQTHRWGWYLEPSYSIALNSDHSKSVGLQVGPIFGIP